MVFEETHKKGHTTTVNLPMHYSPTIYQVYSIYIKQYRGPYCEHTHEHFRQGITKCVKTFVFAALTF